jgi:hypothetical protein
MAETQQRGLHFIENLQVHHLPPYDDTGGKAMFQKVINDRTEQLLRHEKPRIQRTHAFPLPAHVSFNFCQTEACVIGKTK